MPAETRPSEERRRETRLLVTTIVVAVGMLVLLARFRFPAEPLRTATEIVPAPLERLAARATYDELARVMADLEARLTSTVTVLQVVDGTSQGYLPAPTLAPNRAVAVMPRTARLNTGAANNPPLVSRDVVRNLVVVDVTGREGSTVITGSAPSTPGPRYVVVVEATALGPVLRPLYVGRTELIADPRWVDPVLTIAAVQNVAPGSALFALDGSFIGLVSENAGLATVVPSAALRRVAAAAGDAPRRADLGIQAQPLTAALARGAGADSGVMISFVNAAIVGDADLRPGDIVESIDGIGVTTVAGFEEVAQGRTPGSPVVIARVRSGERAQVSVTAADAEAPPRLQASGLGAVLRSIRGVGVEVVSVAPNTVAARSGLRRGDLVIAAGGRSQPDAAALERLFQNAESGGVILLTVQADAAQRVVALEKP